MIPERIKKLEIEITLSQLIPLEARYPVVKTVEISFWLKVLIFFKAQTQKKIEKLCNFLKTV